MYLKMAFMFAMLVAGCAGASLAVDLGDRQPDKPPAAVEPSRSAPIRQGGDTIADATVIPEIPFNDTGTTTGFTDDYDEVCPYSGSTAPDVVYAYTPPMERVLTFDMFGSTYDTKIYLYDQDLNLIACNDDFYPDYVSLLEEILLSGGVTYYLVIDGWNGDHGDYVLNVIEYEPCLLECPPGGMPEGEPPLVEDYEDAFNGGCNSYDHGYPFQDLYGDAEGDLLFCGVSGFYLYEGSNYRDTDWFDLHVGAAGVVEVTGDAEIATYLFELPQDCNIPSVIQNITIGECEPGSMTMTGSPGSVIWFWAGPTAFSGPTDVYEYEYVLEFHGLEPQPVATETASWSAVKQIFR